MNDRTSGLVIDEDGEFLGLKRWWEEHSELDDLVLELVDALENGGLSAAGLALGVLEDSIDSHFTLEENVYFPMIEQHAPRHVAALDGARLGHQKLRTTLNDLGELVDRGEIPEARRLLGVLLERFHVHEQEENKIVADLMAILTQEESDEPNAH